MEDVNLIGSLLELAEGLRMYTKMIKMSLRGGISGFKTKLMLYLKYIQPVWYNT